MEIRTSVALTVEAQPARQTAVAVTSTAVAAATATAIARSLATARAIQTDEVRQAQAEQTAQAQAEQATASVIAIEVGRRVNLTLTPTTPTP